MKRLEFGAGDFKIIDLVAGWNMKVKLGLLSLALVGATPIMPRLVSYLGSSGSWVLFSLNVENLIMKFGGFFLLILFVFYKTGFIAQTVFPAVDRRAPRLQNIWMRLPIYISIIFIIGFIQVYIISYFLGTKIISTNLVSDLGNFLVLTLIVPITEEIYNRFLILYIVNSWSNRFFGVLISVLLFTSGHHQPLSNAIQAIIFGTLTALVIIKCGSLWPALAMHSWNNIIVYFLKSWRLPLL